MMNKQMGIPTKIAALKKEDIQQLSYYADLEANPVYPVPVLFDRKELERFYYDILEESTTFVDEILGKIEKAKEQDEEKELVLA